MDDHMQARVQRIEADVHGLYRMLSITDGDKVRSLLKATFADPRTCIIFRGVQAGMSQPKIAEQLKSRAMKQPEQQRVSDTLKELDEVGLVNRSEKGRYVAAGGLHQFGLDRIIAATLRKAKIPDDIR